MTKVFGDFDVSEFWKPSDYALKEYVGVPPSDAVIAAVERELGYKLPASYVELMRVQNGGIPRRTAHRTKERTTWSHDHIAITGLYSIGRDKRCSLLGECGSRFWADEWGYPQIGVYFADCPSAGHDMVCLGYRTCGPTGEPKVVHIDQECDYKIVHVAHSFEAFIRGLEEESAFDAAEP
jgi:hypothetical protein